MGLIPLQQLQQIDPLRYKALIESTQQPAASLQSTQVNTARTASELPAVQAQSQAATANIPVPAPAQAPTPPSQDAIQAVKSTYQDAWLKAKTSTERDSIATSFRNNTGNNLMNLYLPTGELDTVAQTLQTKETTRLIREGMQSDPNLNKIIGNPLWNAVVGQLQNVPGGNAIVQKAFGLNDKGMGALSNFIKLQGGGDRQMVGGRLSGYMINFFGNAQPGLGRSVSDNINQLNNMDTSINKNLDLYAKNNGFQKWTDIPGASSYNSQPTYNVKKL